VEGTESVKKKKRNHDLGRFLCIRGQHEVTVRLSTSNGIRFGTVTIREEKNQVEEFLLIPLLGSRSQERRGRGALKSGT
jgi:hypothetical protein